MSHQKQAINQESLGTTPDVELKLTRRVSRLSQVLFT
jgi:hypothetical protein